MNRARPPPAAEAIMDAAVLSRGLFNLNCSGLTNCAFSKYRIAIADRTVPMAIFAITT
jgi:hypothetical protein